MMEKQIMELNKRYARKKMLKRIVALLCVFVMLFTVNSLKMVAQTLTRKPMCGLKEHQHKAKCYDSAGNLICGKVEHQHTDACYQESPTLEIEDDSAVGVNNDLALDAGGLSLDLDAGALDLNDDLVTEDVTAPVANEAPVTPTYVLGSKALLSNIIESTGLNIKIKKIKEVGIVDNDGSQVGLVEITKKDNGDYRIKALRDFDQVELAIVLADEVVVVKLLDGVAPAEPVVEEPAAPQVEEAQPAPAVEVEQPEQPAPADESEQPELTVPETEDEQIELAEQPEPVVTEEQADLNVENAQVEQEEVPAAEEMQIEAPVVEDAQVETPVMEAVEPEQPEAPAVVEEVEPEQPEAPAQEEEAEPTEAPAEEEAAEPEPTEAPVVEEPAEPEQIETPVAEEEPTEVATTEEEPTEVPAGEEPVEASVDEEAVPQQTEASALAGEIEAPAVEEAAAPELADADLTVDVPADEAVATEPTEPEQTVSVEEPEVQIEETATEETVAEEIATEETATEEKAAEEIASIEEAVEPAPADAQAEQGDAAEEPAPAEEQAEQEDATEEPAPAEEQAEQGDATEDEAAEPALAEAQAPQEDGEKAVEIEGEEAAQEEIDQLPVDAETADGEAGEPEQDEAAVYTAGSKAIEVNDSIVTLTWPAEAKIPEDVVITIEEIEKGTEDYDLLYHQALAELPEPDQAVTQVMRFFDITLYTADGQKIEPKAPVSVVVSVNEPIDSEVSALHCKKVGAPMETVDANAEGESVAFDAPSFSVYGVNYQVPAEEKEVSSQVQVDLSSVDTMAAAKVDGMSVSLSVADLLAGTDDAVESTVDSTVDAAQFVADATVSSPDVTVENGTITLPAEALEKATVSLQLETKETDKDYITTVTTHTVDIVLSDYAGRTEEATGEGVTVKAVGENSLPADAKASVEENVAVPESVEVGENESATAFDINLTNSNGDTISGPVAVTVMPSDLNVLADLPEGTATEDIQYQLIHIHDDGSTEIVHLPEGAVVVSEDGKVESFSFETESFSTYVLKYTVDFEYVDEQTGEKIAWKWPGEGSYAIADIMKEIDVTGEIGDVSLTRTVDMGGSPKALYLNDDHTALVSEEAFADTFELTVVVDGRTYVLVITDTAKPGYTDLTTLTDNITVNVSQAQNHVIDGSTITDTKNLVANISYTIVNKINDFKALVNQAKNAGNEYVRLDYDLTSLMNEHETLVGLTGSGELKGKGNKTVGNYTVDNGHVLIDLMVSEMDGSDTTDANGTLAINIKIDRTKVTNGGDETYDFPGCSDDLTIEWPGIQHGEGNKFVDHNSDVVYPGENGEEYLEYNYTLTVKGGVGLNQLNLTDYLPQGMEIKDNITIKRDYTTTTETRTRESYGSDSYGAWSAWTNAGSTTTTGTPVTVTPSPRDGSFTIDVLNALSLTEADTMTTTDGTTTQTRTTTDSTYTVTYTGRIKKSAALALIGEGNSAKLKNTATWNKDTTPISGGEAEVTINKGTLNNGTKVIDGVNGDKMQVAFVDYVTEGGQKYAKVSYTVAINEPIDANSAVLTDQLSQYQKLASNTAELWINNDKAADVTFGTSSTKGETITFDLQAALQTLSPQQSFTKNTNYRLKYDTLVSVDDFDKSITNETDWTIGGEPVPGEDKTVIVEKKPYQPGSKRSTLQDHSVTGAGPWEIPWEISTTQQQDAIDVTLSDSFSDDQSVKADSFVIWVGNDSYIVPSNASYLHVNNENHTFSIDFDEALKALVSGLEDPAFKANTQYKVTYRSETSRYDDPATSNVEQSHNESTWTFDGTTKGPDPADEYLKKEEYKPGEKRVSSNEGTGTGNWTKKETAEVESVSIGDNKLDLSYKLDLNEAMDGISVARVSDTYSSYETVDFDNMVLHYKGQNIPVESQYITRNDEAKTFAVDFVAVMRAYKGDQNYTLEKNQTYSLRYNTSIQLTNEIKNLLKQKDEINVNDIKGLTVPNQHSWHFEGPNPSQDIPGEPVEYTFKEKPYNGGTKGFAIYNENGELMDSWATITEDKNHNPVYSDYATSKTAGMKVYFVDRANNTLHYVISLNEHRNASQAVLKDTYYGEQTLKMDSFKVTFYQDGQEKVVNIPASSITTGTAEGSGKTFQFDLVQVLRNSSPSYTFTPNVEYVIEYDMDVSALNHAGGTGASDGMIPTGDGYDNTAHWDFGDGEGEGGNTEIHTDTPELIPGYKTVAVREQVKAGAGQTSDWNYWYINGNTQGVVHGDANFVISNVLKAPSEYDDGAYHLDYVISIKEPMPVNSAVLTDTFKGSAPQTLVQDSFRVTIDGTEYVIPYGAQGTGGYIVKTSGANGDTGFTLRFSDFLASIGKEFKKNVQYDIHYTTTTTTNNNIKGSGDGQDNLASWVIDNTTLDGGHTEVHIKLATHLDKQYYNVTDNAENTTPGGDVHFGDKVKYVITVGKAGDDLRGVWVGDDMWMLQTIDMSKGIIIRAADGTVLADLTKNPASADYSYSAGVNSNAQTASNYKVQDVFSFTFPDKNTKTDGPIDGPVTITYYVDVVSEADYVSLAGRNTTTVPNTAKTNEAEVTVDYDLSVGTITMQKDALEIDPAKIKANDVTVPWSVTVTPEGTTLKGTKIADVPMCYSTVSMEDARAENNVQYMNMVMSSVVVRYLNAGVGHEAGAEVPNTMWTTGTDYVNSKKTDYIQFTGNITEPVVVTFETKGTTGYTGGNVYFYNKAVIRDSGNNDITEPDDAENPYEIDGTVTANKTYLKEQTNLETGEVTWRVTVNTTGHATVYNYAIVESLYKWSTTKQTDWVNNGTGLVYDTTEDLKKAVVKDSEGNTLELGVDYRVEQIPEAGWPWGLRFLKRLTGPITIDIPMVVKGKDYGNADGFGSGMTYLHNEIKLTDGTEVIDTPTADGEEENYNLKVDKTIDNNVYPTAPNFDQTVTYKVVINNASDPMPDGKVKFTDVLPQGMEYIPGSFIYEMYKNYSSVTGYRTKDHEEWTELTVDGNNLSYEFPEEVNLNGASLTILYQAKLTDAEIQRLKNIGTNVVQVYDNHVTVTQADRITGEDHTEWDYQWNNGLDKKDITDEKLPAGLHTPYLYYEIDINPEGRRMNGGRMLVMTDRIETSMELNTNSVKVLGSNGQPIENAKVSYDGITRVLTVRVPDETPCVVTFETVIENAYEGLEKTFTNTAHLKGESSWSDEETHEHRVDTMSGTFEYNVEKAFFVTKIDGNNITKKLEGAEFTLYKATFPAMNNLDYYYEQYKNYDNDKNTRYYDLTPFVLTGQDSTFLPVVKTTNKDGEVLFEHVEPNTLYYWKETKTSSDEYSAGLFAEPQYVILFTNKDQAVVDSEAKAKLLDHLISDANGFIVNTAKDTYNWTATNFKETQYTVKKLWQDKDDEEGLRPDSVWVQLYQDGNPYNDANTPEDDGLVEIKADNKGNWEYTWFDLPANKAGGVDYVYTAKELTPAEICAAGKITEEQKIALEEQLADYKTLYKDVTGGVEITNRKKDETALLVHKEWDDDDNVSRLRPGYIEVKLYRETLTSDTPSEVGQVVQMAPVSNEDNTVEEADRTIKIYANDGWTAEFSGLVTRDGAKTYKYFLVEEPVLGYVPTYSEAYSATLSGGTVSAGTPSVDGIITITNKLDIVKATKKWLDASGAEVWTKDVTFKLMKKLANGTFEDVTKPTYFEENNLPWSQTIKTDTDHRTAIWEHLDKLGDGEAYFAIEYQIEDVEDSAITRNDQGAAMSFTLNGVTYDVTGGASSSGTGTIINAPRVEKEFTKTWENTVYDESDDTNNRKNLSIEIQLQRVNKATGQVDTEFNNDPVKHPEGQVITLNAGTSGTTLTVGGDAVDAVPAADTDETWSYKWTNLPQTVWSGENDESIEYLYRVEELRVLKNGIDVTKAFKKTQANGFAIANSYDGQDIKVSKIWTPEPDGDWSVTAKLKVRERLVEDKGVATEGTWSDWTDYVPEGESTARTVTIAKTGDNYSDGVTNDALTGKHTVTVALPLHRYDTANNRVYELQFSAEEDVTNLPEGYLPSVVVDPETGEITITNEYQKVIVTVEKAWSPMPDDVDNASATVELRRYAIIKNGTINLTLTSNQGGAIEGATFELYKDGAATGRTFLTDASGRISVTGLSEAGDYYLQQTATAEGYRIDGTVKTDTLTVVENSTEKMQVNSNLTNTALVTAGAFTVTLKDGSNNPLQGGVFDLYKQGESTPVVTGATTDGDGQYTKDSLNEGTYYFVQTAAPTGYVLGATTQSDTFVVQDLPGEAQSKTVSFTNLIKAKGSVTISLTSSVDGNAISGAAFELYKDGTKVGEGTTDGSGDLSFANLEAGSYTVKQTSTSDGLAVAADQTFEILENGDTTQHENLMFKNGKSNVRYTLKFQSTADNLSVTYKYVVGTEVTVTFDNGNAYYNPYNGKKLTGGITGTIGDDGYVFKVTITGDVTVTIDPTSNSDWGNVVTNSLHVSPEPVSDALAANRASSFSGRTLMRTPSTTRLMGNNLTNNSATTVIHTDATPVAPDGYANDSSFTAIPYTLRNADGWRHTFAEQDKYDEDGNPYYYYVVETAHTPSENYWVEKYEGDPLNTSGTITVTNKKAVSSVKVTKAFSGIDALPSGFQITNSFNNTVFTVGNATSGNGKDAPYEWVINDVPVGTTVTFTESGFGVDNYDLTVNGTAITTQANVTATATSAEGTVNEAPFSNVYTPKLGALKLKKQVSVNDTPVTNDSTLADGTYTFKIYKKIDETTYSTTVARIVTITITNGAMASVNGATKDSGFAVVSDLEEGDYKIVEVAPTNGVSLSAVTSGKGTDYANVSERYAIVHVTGGDTAAAQGDAVATFTNNIDTTSLKVSKTVISPVPADKTDKQFTFTVTVIKADGNKLTGSFGDYTFDANGQTTVTTTGTQTVTISGLPQGAAYSVTEATDVDFTNTSKTGESGTLGATESTAAFTNTRKLGTLMVTKAVQDTEGHKLSFTTAPKYPITIETKIDGTDYYVQDGTGKLATTAPDPSLTVTAGQSLTINNLPHGSYTVSETDPGSVTIAGYEYVTVTASVSTATPVVNGNSAAVAALTNVYTGENSITVTKRWKGSDNGQAVDIPWPADTTVTVGLYRAVNSETPVAVTDTNGTAMTVVLDKDKTSHSFTGLPKHDPSGAAYTYSVKEIAVNRVVNGSTEIINTSAHTDAPVTFGLTTITIEESNVENSAATITNTLAEIKLDVVKVASGTTTRLNGAKFKLLRKDGDNFIPFANEAFEEVTTTGGQTQKTGQFTVNENTQIGGLLPGDYRLTETQAPAGYIILAEPIEFTINADGTVTYIGTDSHVHLENKSATVQVASIVVTNEAGVALPATGGVGTTIYYIAGASLLLIALAMLVLRRKRNYD